MAQEAAGVYRIREPKRNLHGWPGGLPVSSHSCSGFANIISCPFPDSCLDFIVVSNSLSNLHTSANEQNEHVQKRCRRVKFLYPCSCAHCHETMFFDVPGTHHMAAVLLLRHRGLAEWFHSMYNGSIAINLLMTRDEAAGTHVRLWYPFAVLVPMLSMTSACWGHGKGLVRFGILCHCCGTSPGDLASARAYTISIHNAKNKTLSGDTCHMTLKWCRQSRGVSRETSEGAQC